MLLKSINSANIYLHAQILSHSCNIWWKLSAKHDFAGLTHLVLRISNSINKVEWFYWLCVIHTCNYRRTSQVSRREKRCNESRKPPFVWGLPIIGGGWCVRLKRLLDISATNKLGPWQSRPLQTRPLANSAPINVLMVFLDPYYVLINDFTIFLWN